MKRVDWIKSWARKWIECRFCKRNVYQGELIWKLIGAPSSYYICKACGEKHHLTENPEKGD